MMTIVSLKMLEERLEKIWGAIEGLTEAISGIETDRANAEDIDRLDNRITELEETLDVRLEETEMPKRMEERLEKIEDVMFRGYEK